LRKKSKINSNLSNSTTSPGRLKNLSGLIFVFCGAIISYRTVEDAGPYKENGNILMITSLLRRGFLSLLFQISHRVQYCNYRNADVGEDGNSESNDAKRTEDKCQCLNREGKGDVLNHNASGSL